MKFDVITQIGSRELCFASQLTAQYPRPSQGIVGPDVITLSVCGAQHINVTYNVIPLLVGYSYHIPSSGFVVI